MGRLVGGNSDGGELRSMADRSGVTADDDVSEWAFEHGGSGIRLSYEVADPNGWTFWQDGKRTGVVSGAITNLDELRLNHADVFERLLDGDREIAAAIEGAFLIACYDGTDETWVIVTDKLGARPCYYVENDGFWFADSVRSLLSRRPSPSVDRQGVSDLLLMGHLWGDRTLVRGVHALRPATVLEADPGGVSSYRYWKPDYAEAEPGREYLDELARRYRKAAERTARTLPEEAGLWLSGGLDSRTTAAALRECSDESIEFDTLQTYTYDANPPTNDNPRIANQVVDRLSLDNVTVPLTAETVADNFEQIIDVTDGMMQWISLVNLTGTYNVESPPPVMLEGMQGELVGDHPFRYHLDGMSPVEAQYASEASTTPDRVDELLVPNVDPFETFRTEARRSPESSHRATVLDVHFQNYYSRNTLLSNSVMRDRLGSRVPQVDGEYLEWCARLPRKYRKGTFPLTRRFVQSDAGGVPLGTSRAKLDLCRQVASETADVTYERTKVRPDRPYALHAVGFVGNVAINRLRGKATYGRGQLADFWIRDTETRLHRRVSELVDDACDRYLFDADAVRTVFDDHMTGANNGSLLSKVTTIEYWLQTHLD